MSVLQPAHYSQCGCHTAQGDRQVLSSLVCGEGVVLNLGGGLEVTPSSPAAMTVEVASGNAFIQGDNAAWQGIYHVSNDGTVILPVTAADPVQDRIDLVIAEVRDSTYSGLVCDWQLRIVAGTPGSPPAPPALPVNAVPLAQFTVTAASTTVPSVTDERASYQLCQLQDSGWINVTNIHTGFSAGGTAPQYRKLNGVVYLRGVIQKNSGSFAIASIFTIIDAAGIPAGYRPGAASNGDRAVSLQSSDATSNHNQAIGMLSISSAGVVSLSQQTSSVSTVDLTGVSYIAEN